MTTTTERIAVETAVTATGSGQNSLVGVSRRAASKWIARVSRRATTDGTSVSWLAKSANSANSFFTNVDTTAVGAILRVGTIIVVVALRSATGNRIRFGEETRFASADSHTEWAYHTVRIGAARIRTAWIVT